MTVDPLIVSELRELFASGATPSRLARHVAERHDGDPLWHRLVAEYFEAAFAAGSLVPEAGPRPVDPERIDLSAVSSELVRDMVGRSAAWRETVSAPAGTAWLDGIAVAPDDLRMAEAVRPELHPALAESWPALPPRVQAFIRQSMVNAQGYYERLQTMARLAEALQQQLDEIEVLKTP